MSNTPYPGHRASTFALRALPLALLITGATSLHAGPVPQNLGNGLAELATQQYIAANPRSPLARQQALSKGTQQAMTVSSERTLLRDAADRVMVNVVVDGPLQL